VAKCEPGARYELQVTQAHPDWTRSRVGFELRGNKKGTQVRFYHCDWPEANEHYRVSCYCWAMYLRVLRRYLEYGERVPYEERLTV
jgi:hypothetical protein